MQCIFAVLKRSIFAVDEDKLSEGTNVLDSILERQISYFADEDGLNALLKHIGDSPWRQVFRTLRDGFNAQNSRKPVSLWQGVDPVFKDLVGGLTNFDPAKRLTAHEALAHRWFADV